MADSTSARPSLALFEPEIPANAGNVARVCAATGTPLHLIGRLGFSLRHPAARRAGMDYWEDVLLSRWISYADFLDSRDTRRIVAFSTRGEHSLWDLPFQVDDTLLFGPESRGLPADLVASPGVVTVRIPMIRGARSLNLSTAVGIGLYEALRQTRPVALE